MHASLRFFSALISTLLLIGCIAPPALPITGQPQPDIAINNKTLRADELLLASLPSRGVAPELYNEVWLNSSPLKLADLRGKVVMIKFWTFG